MGRQFDRVVGLTRGGANTARERVLPFRPWR